MDCEPETALLPDQAPEAVQAVALLALQLSVAASPLLIVAGLTVKLNVGAAAVTVTVALRVTLPPAPLQVSVNVLLAVKAPVDCDPLAALLPDHAPEALQPVALVEDHVKVAAAPLATDAGLVLSDKVGAGGGTATGDTVTFTVRVAPPPSPMQVKVKLLLAVSGALVSEPLSDLLPLQAPDALQRSASDAAHVNVVVAPLTTEVGLTLSATLGTGAGDDGGFGAGGLFPPPAGNDSASGPHAASAKLVSSTATANRPCRLARQNEEFRAILPSFFLVDR